MTPTAQLGSGDFWVRTLAALRAEASAHDWRVSELWLDALRPAAAPLALVRSRVLRADPKAPGWYVLGLVWRS